MAETPIAADSEFLAAGPILVTYRASGDAGLHQATNGYPEVAIASSKSPAMSTARPIPRPNPLKPRLAAGGCARRWSSLCPATQRSAARWAPNHSLRHGALGRRIRDDEGPVRILPWARSCPSGAGSVRRLAPHRGDARHWCDGQHGANGRNGGASEGDRRLHEISAGRAPRRLQCRRTRRLFGQRRDRQDRGRTCAQAPASNNTRVQNS